MRAELADEVVAEFGEESRFPVVALSARKRVVEHAVEGSIGHLGLLNVNGVPIIENRRDGGGTRPGVAKPRAKHGNAWTSVRDGQ